MHCRRYCNRHVSDGAVICPLRVSVVAVGDQMHYAPVRKPDLMPTGMHTGVEICMNRLSDTDCHSEIAYKVVDASPEPWLQ